MTRAELRDAALKDLGEDPLAPVYWTATEVDDYAIELLQVFAALTWAIQSTATFTTPSAPFFRIRDYIGDFVAPIMVRSGARIQPRTYKELAAIDEEWAKTPLVSPASGYVCRGGLFTLSPFGPRSLTVKYVAEPPVSAATAIPLPDEDLPIIQGAIVWRARWKQGAQELAKEAWRIQAYVERLLYRAGKVRQVAAAERWDTTPVEQKAFQFSLKPPSVRQMKEATDAA